VELQEIPWVIIQAGGKGTRLGHYTWNKPKCLLSVAGQPILYHFFNRFPSSKFLIIGDYRYEVLRKYLQIFPPSVFTQLIKAKTQGTLSGINQALTYISENDPFLLVWCDLFCEEIPHFNLNDKNWIGLSRSFKCRWLYSESGEFLEEDSTDRGVAGFFVFQTKDVLHDLPDSGEYGRWLASQSISFDEVFLDNTYELGTLESVADYRKNSLTSRFFNFVEIIGDRVIKKACLREFEPLIEKEINWYRSVYSLGFNRIPTLISDTPMTISRVVGAHPFNLAANLQRKIEVLTDAFQTLDRLHSYDRKPANRQILSEVYFDKTRKRVHSIAQLIPHFDQPIINVNGFLCRNPFHSQNEDWFAQLVSEIQTDQFVIIHGDPTFSNLLVDDDNQVWLIDPRGYFGSSLLYGDAMYDWAKLYYSVVGNYDSFNRRLFQLKIIDMNVDIAIESNGWETLESMFTEKFSTQISVIRLLHALIWLSLSGYVKDDYDSILASFYNGLFWLEHAVK
jgi:GTP:adenosylcobinamide-phosphate guanylyltransferase/aminoglycoside phosphotransferase